MLIISVCRALNQAKIKYVIVGGYAVALQGAVRGTVGLDLVLSLDEKSFVNAESIFKSLGLRSRLPVDGRQVFRFRQEYIKNKNLVAWPFYDPAHPAHQLDVIITHDSRKMKTDTIVLEGVKIPVASKKDLIAMKRVSARPQDLEDIKALERIQKESK